MSSSSRSWVSSLLFALGLFSVFIGERAIGSGTARGVLTGLGVALAVLVTVLRAVRASRSSGDARRAEHVLLALYAIGLAGLAAYFAQSDVVGRWLTRSLDQSAPRLAVVLAALAPTLIAAALLPISLVEWAYAQMAPARTEAVIEFGRVRDGLFSGIGLAGALIFSFAAVYVANERDAKWDLSYFRTAKPGEATRKLVRALDEPVTVSIFFPPADEVKDEVIEYFKDLAKESPQLKVEDLDKDVDLAKAKELGVSGNGAIVFHRAGRKETMTLGLKLENARGQLRSLDLEAQRRLLHVTRPERTVYLTSGHGERGDERALANDQRAEIAQLKDGLKALNYDLKLLNAADGLASEIPKDAAAVLMIGPEEPFLPEELSTLQRWVTQDAGRLLIAVDPSSKSDVSPLLEALGVKLSTAMVCNDRVFLQHSHTPSDHANVATASYSAHGSVSTLAQLGERAPLVMVQTSAIELVPTKPKEITVEFTVHSPTSSWLDLNGNFTFEPPEQRKAWNLAAAITVRKPGQHDEQTGRAIVVGDSNVLADNTFRNPGNTYFALEGVRWLLGDDLFAGTVNSENDVRIEHTHKQDVAWFYSTIFAIPALVLGAGFAITRRSRRSGGAR